MSTHQDYYDEPIYFETLELHEAFLVDKHYPSTTPMSPFRTTTIPKMLPYTELDREFSKFCLGSAMVKCTFTNDQNTSLTSVGAGSLLTPIINNCDAKVFISTALHNVIKFGCSLVKLEVKFGKTSVAMFVIHGKIVRHGKLLFPLKHNPKEDWAILELVDTNSGYLFEKFTNHHDYNFLPTLVIPRPSKVEKTIREDRYSLALFSLLIHQSRLRNEDVEMLKRQGFNPNIELENKLLDWFEADVMYASFGYGKKVSKQTLLLNVGTLSACSGAMVIAVDFPLSNDIVTFKKDLKSARFNKVNAIGIQIGYGEEHNVLCPVNSWFEDYYRIVYPEICDWLSEDDKRRIQKEAIFMQRQDIYQRQKLMSSAFCDVEIICKERAQSLW